MKIIKLNTLKKKIWYHHKILFFTILIISTYILSCKKEPEYINKTIDLPAFNSMVLNDPFKVLLNESDSFGMRIYGDKKIVENIEIDITDTILYITNNTKLNMTKPDIDIIEITVNCRNIQKLTANQTCNIKTISPISSKYFFLILKSKANEADIEINCTDFRYWNSFPCGGKLTVRGSSTFMSIFNVGLMIVDAKNLNTKYASVKNSSKGNCTIKVDEYLKYSISNTGNIHLYGSPSKIIHEESSSSGKLIKH